MPVIIADNWNVLREGVDEDTEGNKFFVGKIVVTFWLDKKNPKYATGEFLEQESFKGAFGTIIKKNVLVEEKKPNMTQGLKLVKDKNGNVRYYKSVIKHFRVTYEHQIAVQKVNETTKLSGFTGWSVTLPTGEILCLPKGRGEMKKVAVEPEVTQPEKLTAKSVEATEGEDEVVAVDATDGDEILETVEPVVAEVDAKGDKKEEEKPKFKMVRAQPDDLLSALFLVK